MNHFPKVVLRRIASYLTLEEQASFAQTCKNIEYYIVPITFLHDSVWAKWNLNDRRLASIKNRYVTKIESPSATFGELLSLRNQYYFDGDNGLLIQFFHQSEGDLFIFKVKSLHHRIFIYRTGHQLGLPHNSTFKTLHLSHPGILTLEMTTGQDLVLDYRNIQEGVHLVVVWSDDSKLWLNAFKSTYANDYKDLSWLCSQGSTSKGFILLKSKNKRILCIKRFENGYCFSFEKTFQHNIDRIIQFHNDNNHVLITFEDGRMSRLFNLKTKMTSQVENVYHDIWNALYFPNLLFFSNHSSVEFHTIQRGIWRRQRNQRIPSYHFTWWCNKTHKILDFGKDGCNAPSEYLMPFFTNA